MWSKEFCPHGREAQSIAFFNVARDGPVVLRGDEQYGVDPGDRVLQRGGLRWVVRVVVGAVQRQVPDRDLGELQVVGRQQD
jgi:hypothetical protein